MRLLWGLWMSGDDVITRVFWSAEACFTAAVVVLPLSPDIAQAGSQPAGTCGLARRWRAERADSGVGLPGAGFGLGAAGDGVLVAEADSLDLLFNVLPATACVGEKESVAAFQVGPEFFVGQGPGVGVLHGRVWILADLGDGCKDWSGQDWSG